MLRFFRKIRQGLLNESKVTRYLLYAIGEILLVVIGILIALQVNNWQTQRDNQELERNLLTGIKEDLEEDRRQIEQRFRHSNRDFNKNIRMFDSLRGIADGALEITYVDSIFQRCIRQRNTFFPVTGTYKTVINNGLSDVIENKELFKIIQNLYEAQYESLVKSGDRADQLSDKIRYELRNLTALSELDRMSYYKSMTSRNDVEIYRLHLDHFARILNGTDDDLIDIIDRIDAELE